MCLVTTLPSLNDHSFASTLSSLLATPTPKCCGACRVKPQSCEPISTFSSPVPRQLTLVRTSDTGAACSGSDFMTTSLEWAWHCRTALRWFLVDLLHNVLSHYFISPPLSSLHNPFPTTPGRGPHLIYSWENSN